MDKETLAALAAFKEELEDRVFRIRNLLESLPDRAMAVEPQGVHELFRELHSLKGAANLLGLRPIDQLTHKMEDILSAVRNREVEFDARLRGLLLAVLGRVEELGEDLRKVRLADVGPELAKIDRYLKGG